jgi:hypothetical protein
VQGLAHVYTKQKKPPKSQPQLISAKAVYFSDFTTLDSTVRIEGCWGWEGRGTVSWGRGAVG